MAIIQQADLPGVRIKHHGEIIVFASGSFDLTHAAHAVFLENCKRHGDILVVVVARDYQLRHKGPDRPIIKEEFRLKMIDSLKPVDYALFVEGEIDPNDCCRPFEPVFKVLQPDIWMVNEDALDTPHREKMAAQYGIRLVIGERWSPPGWGGTTGIIQKILRTKEVV